MPGGQFLGGRFSAPGALRDDGEAAGQEVKARASERASWKWKAFF